MEIVKNEQKYWEFIRELRNMDGVREGFIQQNIISKEHHEKYMKKNSSFFYIVLDKGIPICYIGNIDNDIRVATHPDHQGKGAASFAVNELMKMHPNAMAKVKINNKASLRLFEKCGFKKEILSFGERMRHNPFEIVRMFEETVADYCGAPYAVSTDNCTDALLVCCEYLKVKEVTIPQRTYLSVPQSIMHAGGTVKFRDYRWNGIYQLEPYPIWDAAKRLTSNMYIPGSFMCLSFHIKKHLKIGKGGMILTDNKEAADWLKKARYEGRGVVKYHQDNIQINGWNAYMSPEMAARGLMLMQNYPEEVPDLPEEPWYRDLKEFDLFKDIEVVK